MSHIDFPSYTYFATVDLHKVCNFIYSSNSPINEKLNELGSPVGAGSIGCAGIALAGTAVGGGAGFVVASVVCAGSTVGCAIEGIIEGSTSCGNVQTEIYIASNPTTTSPNVMVVPRCESGALAAGVEDFIETAEEYGSDSVETGKEIVDDVSDDIEDYVETGEEYGRDAVETGEEFVDDASDSVNYVVRGSEDIASDLADNGGDIVDEGSDLIDDGLGAIGF